MTCAEFAMLAVSDEPADRERAQAHAAACAQCAKTLAGWARLHELVGEWRQEEPVAPAALVARREARGSRRSMRTGRTWAALAAAAVLAVVTGLSLRSATAGPATAGGGLLAAEALREAEDAERSHARAVAKLEAAVQPLLERGTDPRLPAEQAAQLLAYRDRLQFLDRTLVEVEGFLEVNPYNAKARTLLLAGFIEKREILREVLALAAKNPDLGGTVS